MRLLVLGPGHPFRGGIARTTTELVLALRGRGHEVTYITPRRQYPPWLFPGRRDRDPEACREVEGAEALLDPFDPLHWDRVRRAARAARAEAWVIPYWTWAWAPLWRVLLSTPDRPPAVVIVHNVQDHDAGLLQRLAANLVLGRCDGAFAHARVLAEAVRRRVAGLAVASYPLPPTGAPPVLLDRAEARRRLQLPETGRIALFLGLVRPYKGVDRLVEAAALPPAEGWQFVIAGEPWGREGVRIADLAARLGVVHRVLLRLQWVPEEEMPVYFAAADAVVLPYRRGSQSAVAPLALAAGVPVVSSAVGGLPEVVVDGVNGRLVGAGRPEEIAAVLGELDEAELARLAEGARRCADTLTWDGYAAALEALLRDVTV